MAFDWTNVAMFLQMVLGVALGCVLLTAGLAKLADRWAFAATVRAWGVRERVAHHVSLWLPAVELVLGVALIASIPAGRLVIASAAAAVLFAAFVLGQVMILAKVRLADCGCFGRPHRIGRGTLSKVAAYFVAAMVLFLLAV